MYNIDPSLNNRLMEQRNATDRLTRAQEDYNWLYAKANGLEEEFNKMYERNHPILVWLGKKTKNATIDHDYMGSFFNE